jgi:hypothetical protein
VETNERAISLYAKAALQASNDRLNRVRRGVIVEAVLQGLDANMALVKNNLVDN